MNKITPSISIIMLTYNREDFVGRAIESILKQTMTDFEFIIVDNGSTDNSGTICEQYAKKDSRIHFISKEKGNIGSGRNLGLDCAKGEYIAFVDDDDIAYPEMFSFLLQLARKYNADISICGSDKNVNMQYSPNCVFDDLLILNREEALIELLKRKKYNSATPTKLWKRNLFDSLRFPLHGKYDDITIVYKLFAEANIIAAHGTPQYCFWRHSTNNSAFTTDDSLLTPEQLDTYFDAFSERTKYLSEKVPSIAPYVRYSEWSYMISMCNKIISNQLDNCSKQLQYIKNHIKKHYVEFYYSPYIQPFEKSYMDKYIANLIGEIIP